ncbi:MAG: hypothetical protein ACYTGC_15075 [Planctomycetota bacterium]
MVEEVYQEDRRCGQCGYNLRGLRVGGTCPECGAPMRRPPVADLPMSAAPVSVIRRLRTASWSASVCALLMAAWLVPAVWPTVIFSRVWMDRYDASFNAVFTMLGALWFGVVWFLTPVIDDQQARIRGFSAGGRLRVVVRATQLCWALYGVVLIVLAMPGLPAAARGPMLTVQGALELGCAVAIVTLCIMLHRVAEWTRDDTAQMAFNWIGWGVSTAYLLMLISRPHMGMIAFVIRIAVLPALCLVLLPLGLLSLSRSLSYSILHNLDDQDREIRRQARRRRYDEQVAVPAPRTPQRRSS